MGVILSGVNQETLCYTSRVAAMASVIVGFSAGGYYMECYSPLGRRFLLRGPSVGIGTGFVAAVSLPNSKHMKNDLAYKFLLFTRSERQLWHMSTTSSGFTSIFGMNAEYDFHKQKTEGLIYGHNIRTTAGAGFFSEQTYQIMAKKNLNPLYIRLIRTGLFDKIAKSVSVK